MAAGSGERDGHEHQENYQQVTGGIQTDPSNRVGVEVARTSGDSRLPDLLDNAGQPLDVSVNSYTLETVACYL